VTGESPNRRLFAGSLVLSAIGVVLLAWWFFDDPRSWWALGAGALAALAGVVLGARSRRVVPADEKRGRG
jgi:drug/metabolite transporter (DMT)-like permease